MLRWHQTPQTCIYTGVLRRFKEICLWEKAENGTPFLVLSGKSLVLGTFIPPSFFSKGRCREILHKNSVGGSNKKPHTEFVTLEAYGERDYVVPKNYEHIRDNIYAVVKDGLIMEYKKIVFQSGQYVWLDCEAEEIMK